MALATRKPTGRPAFPLVLVEGEEKGGKSYTALSLSASPKVGRTFVFDLGDGAGDEYAALGPYEMVDTNGTYSDLADKVRLATLEPADEGRPNVIVIDSGTQLWDLLKARADRRARNSKSARQKLKDDPDAEIDVSMNYWNDAKEQWARIIQLVRFFPGIGIITAQGQEVTEVDADGRPTRSKSWSVSAEKTLPAAVTAWVRVKRDRTATLIGVRRLGVDVPNAGLALPPDRALEHLVFDVIGAGTEFEQVQVAQPTLGIDVVEAKQKVFSAVQRQWPDESRDDQANRARALWADAGLGDECTADALADLIAKVLTDQDREVAPASLADESGTERATPALGSSAPSPVLSSASTETARPEVPSPPAGPEVTPSGAISTPEGGPSPQLCDLGTQDHFLAEIDGLPEALRARTMAAIEERHGEYPRWFESSVEAIEAIIADARLDATPDPEPGTPPTGGATDRDVFDRKVVAAAAVHDLSTAQLTEILCLVVTEGKHDRPQDWAPMGRNYKRLAEMCSRVIEGHRFVEDDHAPGGWALLSPEAREAREREEAA